MTTPEIILIVLLAALIITNAGLLAVLGSRNDKIKRLKRDNANYDKFNKLAVEEIKRMREPADVIF